MAAFLQRCGDTEGYASWLQGKSIRSTCTCEWTFMTRFLCTTLSLSAYSQQWGGLRLDTSTCRTF